MIGAYIINSRNGSVRYMSKLKLQQAVDEATINGAKDGFLDRRFMPYGHNEPPEPEKERQK
jgi:hypothetical protein